MPLINGACIPPVCYRRAFVGSRARLQRTKIVGGVSTVYNIGPDEWPNPEMLKKGVHELGLVGDSVCDGCICFTVRSWDPPLQISIPPFTVDENSEKDKNGVLTVQKYQVVGASWLLKSVGWCFAPGTHVRIGDKWIPIEDAVKRDAKVSSSGEDKSQKKKKHPSKPKPHRGKRLPKKKAPG